MPDAQRGRHEFKVAPGRRKITVVGTENNSSWSVLPTAVQNVESVSTFS